MFFHDATNPTEDCPEDTFGGDDTFNSDGDETDSETDADTNADSDTDDDDDEDGMDGVV